MTLYKFMLVSMNDEERFQTTFRLCHDVLNGTVEDQIPLGQKSFGVLQVCILTSFDFKVAYDLHL
jgi:hypothetical protein